MMDIEEAMRSFHDFEHRASSKRSTQIDRIKEDRYIRLSSAEAYEPHAELISGMLKVV